MLNFYFFLFFIFMKFFILMFKSVILGFFKDFLLSNIIGEMLLNFFNLSFMGVGIFSLIYMKNMMVEMKKNYWIIWKYFTFILLFLGLMCLVFFLYSEYNKWKKWES